MSEETSKTPLSLESVAEIVGGRLLGDPTVSVDGVVTLDQADAGQLGFVATASYVKLVRTSKASALLIRQGLTERLEAADRNRAMVVVDEPHRALRLLLNHFHPKEPFSPGVHPTAVIADDAGIGDGVWIGPGAVIEQGATVGEGVFVGPQCVIGAGSSVGRHCTLHARVVLYPGVQLGDRVIIHSGACIGADGYGYVFVDGEHQKIPQVGTCVIEDDVEIGANTCIDRGSIGSTRIGRGSKIDNLVQIAHNVVVGADSLIVAQVGVAGSSRIGRGVMLAGQVGISGHVEIGDGAKVGGQAGVTGNVPAGTTYWGSPARPHRETLKRLANMGKVEDLARRVGALEEASEDADDAS